MTYSGLISEFTLNYKNLCKNLLVPRFYALLMGN